jgi:DNA-directed RNA polymerase subunit K/omega
MSKNKKLNAIKSIKNDTEESDDSSIEDIDNTLNEEEIINSNDTDSDSDASEESEESENECLIDKTIEDDNDFFGTYQDSEFRPNKNEEQVSKENRISNSRLTKYEMVRILGERTKQLIMGAKPLIKNYEKLSYEQMAEEELKLNMIPFKIKRPLPNGKYEIWLLEELNKEHLLSFLE